MFVKCYEPFLLSCTLLGKAFPETVPDTSTALWNCPPWPVPGARPRAEQRTSVCVQQPTARDFAQEH